MPGWEWESNITFFCEGGVGLSWGSPPTTLLGGRGGGGSASYKRRYTSDSHANAVGDLERGEKRGNVLLKGSGGMEGGMEEEGVR